MTAGKLAHTSITTHESKHSDVLMAVMPLDSRSLLFLWQAWDHNYVFATNRKLHLQCTVVFNYMVLFSYNRNRI